MESIQKATRLSETTVEQQTKEEIADYIVHYGSNHWNRYKTHENLGTKKNCV